MSSSAARIVAVSFVALWASALAGAAGDQAPPRFEVLSRDAIAAVAGLNVYTIRDNRLSSCFTLFVLDRPEVQLPDQSIQLPPELTRKMEVAEILRDAGARRDQQVEALRKRIDPAWSVEYQRERMRIEDEYGRVVRSVIPGMYPPEQVAPGYRTSGSDVVNETARRTIAEAEAAVAAAERARIDRQLERVYNRLTETPRLAVSAPTPCSIPSQPAVR
jgi:hypothetical protein